MPAISILTISFNQREFLEDCLDSVRSQSFQDYEHIVVDPGSTDGSREWLEERADPRVRVVLKPDDGPPQGLNHGLLEACGDVVAYMNADDAFAPEALTRIHELHAGRPAMDILVGNGWTIDEAGLPLDYVRSDRFSPYRYSLRVGTVLQQATSFKRRLFVDGLKFNEANRLNWDTELLFDAYARGASFEQVSDCLGYFRLQPSSITMSGLYEQRLVEERARLNSRLLRGVPSSIVGISSFLARAHKKAKNVLLNGIEHPRFPGSSGTGSN